LRIEINFLDRIADASVMPFYNALSYLIGYFGLPRDRHDELTANIEAVLRDFFT
jgi:hypothetical protein